MRISRSSPCGRRIRRRFGQESQRGFVIKIAMLHLTYPHRKHNMRAYRENNVMSASYLSAPHFHDEQAAIAFVEARVWEHGRPCPHCGVMDDSGRLQGKST